MAVTDRVKERSQDMETRVQDPTEFSQPFHHVRVLLRHHDRSFCQQYQYKKRNQEHHVDTAHSAPNVNRSVSNGSRASALQPARPCTVVLLGSGSLLRSSRSTQSRAVRLFPWRRAVFLPELLQVHRAGSPPLALPAHEIFVAVASGKV